MSEYVPMLKSGVRGFANAVKRFAIKDKQFAEELVYMHGIRSEITPNALKSITKDMFDKGGKLTQKGKNEVKGLLEMYNLPQNATWEDAFAAIRAYKEKITNQIRIQKLRVPKLEMSIPDRPDSKLLSKEAKEAFSKTWAELTGRLQAAMSFRPVNYR